METVIEALNDNVSHLRISNIAGRVGFSRVPKIAFKRLEIGENIKDLEAVMSFVTNSHKTLRVLDVGKSEFAYKLFWHIFHCEIALPFPQLYCLQGSIPLGAHYSIRELQRFPKLVSISVSCHVAYIRDGVPVDGRMESIFMQTRGNAAKLRGVVTLYLCMKHMGVPRDVRLYICEPMWNQQLPWINAADLKLQPGDIINHPNFKAICNAYERYTNADAYYLMETKAFKRRRTALQHALTDKNKARIEYEKVLKS
jgi:hypothetical protein